MRCRIHWTAYVVPTLVGVDRSIQSDAHPFMRCPHARGGGPRGTVILRMLSTLSPRSWGWTESGGGSGRRNFVVPTLVGVDRQR